jgi:hypothetical protein
VILKHRNRILIYVSLPEQTPDCSDLMSARLLACGRKRALPGDGSSALATSVC